MKSHLITSNYNDKAKIYKFNQHNQGNTQIEHPVYKPQPNVDVESKPTLRKNKNYFSNEQRIGKFSENATNYSRFDSKYFFSGSKYASKYFTSNKNETSRLN